MGRDGWKRLATQACVYCIRIQETTVNLGGTEEQGAAALGGGGLA